jgi:hypothetical protein
MLTVTMTAAGVGYAQVAAPDAPPAVPAVKDVAAGAGKILDDAALLSKVPQGMDVVVIVRDTTGLDTKVGDFLAAFMPQEANIPPGGPQLLAQLLSRMTDSNTAVKANSPLIFVVKFGPEMNQPPPMAVLIDLVDLKTFVGESKPNEQGVYVLSDGVCAPYNGLVMFCADETVAASMMKAPAGIKLNPQQMEMFAGSDAYAHIDAVATMAALTPMYEKAHQQTAERLKQYETPEDGADPAAARSMQRKAGEMKAALKAMETGWDLGQQVEWAAAGGTINGKAVDIRFTGAFKPGSKLGGYLSGHPALGAKLTPALPSLDNVWLAAWWSIDNKKLAQGLAEGLGFVRSFMDSMLASAPEGAFGAGPDPRKIFASFGKLEELLKTKGDLMVAAQGAIAALQGKPGASLFNIIGVQKVGGREDYALRLSFMEEVQQLYSNDLLLGAGSAKIDAKIQRGARQVGDLTLDRFTVTMTKPADAPQVEGPDPAKMVEKIWGGAGMSSWLAFAEGHLIQQTGAEPDKMAEMAKALKGGPGLVDSPDYQALRQYALKDANMVVYVSVASCADLVMSFLLPLMGGGEMPAMAPGALKIKSVLSASISDSRLGLRLYVPTDDLRQVVSRFMMMRAVQMENRGMPPVQPNNRPRDNGGAPPMM